MAFQQAFNKVLKETGFIDLKAQHEATKAFISRKNVVVNLQTVMANL